MFVFRINSKKY